MTVDVPLSPTREEGRRRISRFRVLAAGLILELCGGSIYIVSLYLHQLETLWFPGDPLSLEKAESLAFACNLGNWIPIAGIFYDWRYGGPRNTVLAACLLTFVGYGGLWLCSVHMPEGGYSTAARLWLLRVLWFTWGHGSSYFDCACITTTAHNFSRERGSAMGVVKALYGLSGSLLTQPYVCFFRRPGGAAAFLAFLAVGLSSLGACAAPFVKTVQFSRAMMNADQPTRRLRLAVVAILALALMLAATGVLRSLNLLSRTMSYVTLGVATAGVIGLTSVSFGSSVSTAHCALLPPAGEDGLPASPARTSDGASVNTATRAETDGSGNASSGDGAVVRWGGPPAGACDDSHVEVLTPAPAASLTDETVWTTLRTSNFWLIFIAFFAGTGGGLVLTNHISFIVLAQLGHGKRDEAARTTDSLISLFSVFNCIGRLAAGMGSDLLRRVITRPFLFSIACILMGLCHAMLLFARFTILIFAATITGGLAYGAFWSLLPTLVGELFGLTAFASTYMAYSLATSSASLVLSTQLASRVAEAHTEPAPPAPPGMPPPPPTLCYGDDCYRLTHFVVIGCCALGALCVSVVGFRTRHFYRRRLTLTPTTSRS